MDKSFWERLPKKRMASGALIRNKEGEILIVKPSYRDGWLIPGGIVEDNESPLTTCKREIKEEINLDINPHKLLVVDYSPSGLDYLEGVEFVFDGGTLTASQISSIILQSEELLMYKFIPREAIKDYLVIRLCHRIEAALIALDRNETYYTESGKIQGL